VKVTLSNYFTNQNIVPLYYGVEVQFHAFFTTAIGGVVPIPSTSHGYLPVDRTTGATEFEAVPEEQKGRIGQENVLFYKYGNRNTFYHTVG
jgi:hypothetical protein